MKPENAPNLNVKSQHLFNGINKLALCQPCAKLLHWRHHFLDGPRMVHALSYTLFHHYMAFI